MSDLKNAVIKLAFEKPHLREHLLPILKEAVGPESILSPGKASESKEVQNFLKDIERQFRKVNKHGLFQARASTKFGHNSIFLQFTLLPKDKWSNGIINNDPSHHQVWMHDSYTDEGMSPIIHMERSMGGSVTMNRDRHKIGWRDAKGSPEAIVRKLGSYFQKMTATAESLGYTDL